MVMHNLFYLDTSQLSQLISFHVLCISRPKDVEESCGATYYSRLEDMLPLCDFVIIVCPLTPETTKLFGDKQFSLMKKTATLVNIARGNFLCLVRCSVSLQVKLPYCILMNLNFMADTNSFCICCIFHLAFRSSCRPGCIIEGIEV